MNAVFIVNPCEVPKSIGLLIDLAKAANLRLYPGSWGTPICLSVPKKEEDKDIVLQLLKDAGFKPKEGRIGNESYHEY